MYQVDLHFVELSAILTVLRSCNHVQHRCCILTSLQHACAGVLFFSLVLFGAPLNPMLATFGLTPLMAAVLVGAAQNVFSKSSKYSLFDPCKEMAYIPLDQETQVGHCVQH